MTAPLRFPISFNPVMAVLGRVLGLGRRQSWVDVDDTSVVVRMGWAFRARLDRDAVVAATPSTRRVISMGAHGWRHRWLVNGSRDGIVVIDLEPMQRGRTAGFPLWLRQVAVSVDDPDGLIAALHRSVG